MLKYCWDFESCSTEKYEVIAKKLYVFDQFKFSRFFPVVFGSYFFEIVSIFFVSIKIIWIFGLKPQVFLLNGTLDQFTRGLEFCTYSGLLLLLINFILVRLYVFVIILLFWVFSWGIFYHFSSTTIPLFMFYDYIHVVSLYPSKISLNVFFMLK